MRLNVLQWRSQTAMVEKNTGNAVRFSLLLGSTMTSVTVSGDHRATLEEALVAPAGEMVFFEDEWEARTPDARLKVESLGERVDISVVCDLYTFTAHFTAEETSDLAAFLAEELPERFRD